MSNPNGQKIITRDELAHYAAALLKRIRDDNSSDIEDFRIAQQFFIEYIKDTELLNEFAKKHNYLVVDPASH